MRSNVVSIRLFSRCLAAAIVALVVAGQSVLGQTWSNGVGDQDWNNPGNWAGGFPNGVNATINTSAAGQFPIISATPTSGTPRDIFLGNGGGQSGRLDQTGGDAGTGSGNWFFIGLAGGTGVYNLSGGRFFNDANTFVGIDPNTTSSLNVSGTGEFNGNTIEVASNGENAGNSGTVTLSDSGRINASNLYIARSNSANDGGVGLVTVNSGTLSVTNELAVGYGGSAANGASGQMDVNGGTVNVSGFHGLNVGVFDSVPATLNIDGGDININSNSRMRLAVDGGYSGTAVVNHNSGDVTYYSDAGATVGGTGVLDLKFSGSATANTTYNLNGGTLTVPKIESSSTSGTRTFNVNGGTLKAAGSASDFFDANTATTADVQAGGGTIDNAGHSITIGQSFSGTGGLIFDDSSGGGAGTTTLTGVNTYLGGTTVNGGTLLLGDGVSGSLLSNVDVNAGATFGGSGDGTAAVDVTGNLTFTGSVGSVATFAPGSSIGSLDVLGNVSLDSNSVLQIEYDSTLQTIDSIDVVGQLSFLNGATINFAEFNPGVLTESEYVFADFLSTNGFSLGDLNLTNVPGGYEVSLSSTSMSLVVAAIPEVSGFFCLGLVSAATLSGVARRRVRAAG